VLSTRRMAMNLRRLSGIGAGAAAALASASAFAASEGGMPQLNFHDFPPQVAWLAITFIVLYVIMAKFALPRAANVLETRNNRIKSDLDRATALKSESDKVIAAYEKALTDARNNAASVARETAASLAQKSSERQTKLGADLAGRIKT